MVKYREILRLRAMGASQQNTARSCGCAASTVQEVEKRARVAGLEWPLPEEVDDAAIRARLYPKAQSRSAKFPIDHEEVDAELMRRGMTLALCWNEYREEAVASGGGPYQYSAFCQRHRKWAEANAFTMRVGRKCGEETEVDWAGDPMEHHDPDTGLACKARVFVACLPWSQHTFAEAFPDMGEESWTAAHVHAFAFLGGSTPIPVPDSCKTGVTRNTVDELIVNEQYRRMAGHYGCAVVPARPRRPRDKGSVEAAVGLVGRQAMAPLRDRALLSLAELSAALAAKVAAINARPFQEREGSRESGYLGQEKGSLIPLPAHPYRIVVHKSATVQLSYHVAFEGMFYSVPFTCLRKKADIAATATALAIAVDGERVATHPRLHGAKGQYSTNPEHMPDAHRDYAEWNGDRFRRWAAEKGAPVAAAVDAMLRSRTVEQQAYRTCRALLDLGRRHGDDVLEEACSKALGYSRNPSYKTVKTIAAKLASDKPGEPDGHAYLRGSEYYDGAGADGSGEGAGGDDEEEWPWRQCNLRWTSCSRRG